MEAWRGTTILCVSQNGSTVMAGDGQVTMGNTVVKGSAKKVRRIYGGRVVAGFAGGTADAFTLFERFENQLEKHSGDLVRAAVEMAKDWRTDRSLRKLEAMMIVADKDKILILSGVGDVMDPDDGIAAIGSGGAFAKAAALALKRKSSLSAEDIVKEAMDITAKMCIYTNDHLTVEKVS